MNDSHRTTARVLNGGLGLYRKTLKRFRPAHVALHRLMSHSLIPLLETAQGFHTLPDDPFWFRLELLTGQHERETVAHMRRLAQPGMVVLDIGAHVGYYGRRLARRIGSHGQLIAFEPHPRNFTTLQRNLAAYDNVRLLQLAVAETEGTAELYDYLMMSASGSLHYDETLRNTQRAQVGEGDYAPRMAAGHDVETFTVRTRPVDDCLADWDIRRVDLVKMDIEGAELGALRGMRRTIAQSPALSLIMEYNPLGLIAFGHDPVPAVDEVMAMGFKRVQIIESSGTLTDLTGDVAALHVLTDRLRRHMGVVNLLFTRVT